MKTKLNFKPALFAASLALNALFVLLLVLLLIASSFSGSNQISFPKPPDGYFAAAAVLTVPSEANSAQTAFCPFEISLKQNEKFFLQYSIHNNGKQGNVIINALYDPKIVSISQIPGFGIIVTALAPGETLLQSVGVGGVSEIARVFVLDVY